MPPVWSVVVILFGVALFAAGLWWLGGGRWTWLPALGFQPRTSLPTRMVVAIVHLVLGYHLVVWSIPGDRRPMQFPRGQWPWMVLGCAAAIGGSRMLDRLEQSGGSGAGDSADE